MLLRVHQLLLRSGARLCQRTLSAGLREVCSSFGFLVSGLCSLLLDVGLRLLAIGGGKLFSCEDLSLRLGYDSLSCEVAPQLA